MATFSRQFTSNARLIRKPRDVQTPYLSHSLNIKKVKPIYCNGAAVETRSTQHVATQFRYQSVYIVFSQAGSDVSTEHIASIFREEPSSYYTQNIVLFPDRDRRFTCPKRQADPRAHPTIYTTDSVDNLMSVKRPRREANQACLLVHTRNPSHNLMQCRGTIHFNC